MPSPWRRRPPLADLNALAHGTLSAALGIELLAIADDALIGRMPVDARTRQPYGLLHGGASVALAETLGSIAAVLTLDDPERSLVVGVEINANHLRAVRSGWVHGAARPLKLGRRFQVWQIDINADDQRLVCASRFTAAIVPRDGLGIASATQP
jgi:1,4-dihydroxy-2-naphthoyl-CoA hydrolase